MIATSMEFVKMELAPAIKDGKELIVKKSE
jgi:hypothetical protein